MFIILILQAIVKMSTTTNQPTLTTPREFKCICGSGKHFFDCNHNNTKQAYVSFRKNNCCKY